MSDELETTTTGDDLPEPPDVSGAPEPGAAPEGDGAPEPQKPDELRAAMTELAGTVSKLATAGRQEPAARQPTPDEISELWAIYNPEKTNKDFFRKFFRLGDDVTPDQLEEAKQLFVGMHEGLMRQAMQGARNFISIEMDRLQQEIGPIKEYVENARREATRERFYGSYPGLGEDKFSKIVSSVALTLNEKTFGSEEEYFKELAEGSAAAIKEILPDFDLGKAPETKRKLGQTPKLPRTSVGGGGGAGKGRDVLQPTGSKNDIDSLENET
jgi:hypothetical protein